MKCSKCKSNDAIFYKKQTLIVIECIKCQYRSEILINHDSENVIIEIIKRKIKECKNFKESLWYIFNTMKRYNLVKDIIQCDSTIGTRQSTFTYNIRKPRFTTS